MLLDGSSLASQKPAAQENKMSKAESCLGGHISRTGVDELFRNRSRRKSRGASLEEDEASVETSPDLSVGLLCLYNTLERHICDTHI